MGFRFRRSVRLFPGLRVNLGLRGVSLSAGMPGATVNLSQRGVRTTLGLPGTGLSYTSSSASPRRGATPGPRRSQVDAMERRLVIEERREAALEEVEVAEARLEALLEAWRDAPDLPSTEDYLALACPAPFVVHDAPRPAPDERAWWERARQEALADAETEAPPVRSTLVTAALVGVAGATLSATLVLILPWGVLARVVVAAAPLVMSVVGAAVWALRAWAQRRVEVELAAERELEKCWPDQWLSIQRAHLAEVHAWEGRRDEAQEAHDATEGARANWVQRLLDGDLTAVEESVAESLADLDFPFEALCRVDVPDAGRALLLLDLPEVEDVVPETKARVLRSGATKEVKRTKAERMEAYAGLACGLAFLMARVAFVAGPTLKTVTIAAYTQRRQRRSGALEDDFVYEVTLSRAVSAVLDPTVIDPVQELERLPSRIRRTATGEMAKIPAPAWMDA